MKKTVLLLMLLLGAGLLIYSFFETDQEEYLPTPSSATVDTVTDTILLDSNEQVLQYATYKGMPVQLYNSDGDLIVRISVGEYWGEHWYKGYQDSALVYLMHEVERLTTGQKVPLGTTGYTFQFTGGNPIWGPHMSVWGKKGTYSCISFAENATWKNKSITAAGSDRPITPEMYYPYKIPS